MKIIKNLLAIVCISLLLVSCKSDKKEVVESVNELQEEPIEEIVKEAEPEMVELKSVETVETPPIYPECEGTPEELKKCLQMSISNYVAENFNADLSNNMKEGDHKIMVMFVISEKGMITKVKAKAANEELQAEAIRVLESIPQMIPAKDGENKVSVQYTLPITFKVGI